MERAERTLAAIARRLRATRDALELKKGQFAGLAGIASNTYSQWESGKRRPHLDEAIRLADAHRITLDWIYLGDASGLPLKISSRLSAAVTVIRAL
jgi:transcriptional regulator with XRE-family HTH domain